MLTLEKLGAKYNSTESVLFHNFFRFKIISKLNEKNSFTYTRNFLAINTSNIISKSTWLYFYNFFPKIYDYNEMTHFSKVVWL